MVNFSVLITLVCFLVGGLLNKKYQTPFCNPVLVAIVLVMLYLLFSGLTYKEYAQNTHFLTDLLGPSVVALAIPLYQAKTLLREQWKAILAGVLVGGTFSIGFGWFCAWSLSFPSDYFLAALTKSATTPISVAIAEKLGRSASLAAIVAVFTGILGAAIGPQWLTRIGVTHPLARGLAMGVASHGVGTARILEEGDTAGAASSLAMGLTGALVAFLVPILWRFFGF